MAESQRNLDRHCFNMYDTPAETNRKGHKQMKQDPEAEAEAPAEEASEEAAVKKPKKVGTGF